VILQNLKITKFCEIDLYLIMIIKVIKITRMYESVSEHSVLLSKDKR